MSRLMPTATDYQNVLTNLQTFITVPELKAYQVVRGSHGRPLIYAGGFALTIPIQHPVRGDRLALRFFLRLPDAVLVRYRAISDFIRRHEASGIFAVTTCYEQGVLVEGETYPLTVMQWLPGVTLRTYVEQYLQNPEYLLPLARDFYWLMERLHATGAAHGDLSHENIMMVNGRMMLVDYDSLYVPALSHLDACIIGQLNFQHPARRHDETYFGPYQDNFSSIAIYLSLLGLQRDLSLYDRYRNGGNSLLFRQDDFIAPYESPLLAELESYPEMAPYVRAFRQVCEGDLYAVPSLRDFLPGVIREEYRRRLKMSEVSSGAVFSVDMADTRDITLDLDDAIRDNTRLPILPKTALSPGKLNNQRDVSTRARNDTQSLPDLDQLLARQSSDWSKGDYPPSPLNRRRFDDEDKEA